MVRRVPTTLLLDIISWKEEKFLHFRRIKKLKNLISSSSHESGLNAFQSELSHFEFRVPPFTRMTCKKIELTRKKEISNKNS